MPVLHLFNMKFDSLADDKVSFLGTLTCSTIYYASQIGPLCWFCAIRVLPSNNTGKNGCRRADRAQPAEIQ